MPSPETQFGKSEISDDNSPASSALEKLEAKFGEQSIQELDESLKHLEDFHHILNPEVFATIRNMILTVRHKLVDKMPEKPGNVIQLSDYRSPDENYRIYDRRKPKRIPRKRKLRLIKQS